jgi:heme/copper-type cytochrome/quinol oxidase subunit 2
MTDATPAPAAPTPAPAPAGTDYPGKTLGIVGLILAIFFNVIGIIVSAVALSQSKKAGYKNGPAKAGIIVGIILFVLSIIGVIIAVTLSVSAFGTLAQICAELGEGVWDVNGVTYTCG